MKPVLLNLVLLSIAVGSLNADPLDDALNVEEKSQTATSITIIFDNSGSMAEDNKLVEAKKAFTTWLASLPKTYSLGLIHFKVGKAVLAVPTGTDNREALIKSVNGLKPYGKTPICGCLAIARSQIAKRRIENSPYERHMVVVFTDGLETVDRRGNQGVVEEIIKLRNIKAEVVGIGFHGQGDYMKPAATSYFDASSEAELVSGLARVDAEIGDDGDIEVSPQDIAAISDMKISLPPPPSAFARSAKKKKNKKK